MLLKELNINKIKPEHHYKVCIYGTGKRGACILKLLEKVSNIEVTAFLDSYKSGVFEGYEIIKIDDFDITSNDIDYIIVASAFADEICETLKAKGLNDISRVLVSVDNKEYSYKNYICWGDVNYDIYFDEGEDAAQHQIESIIDPFVPQEFYQGNVIDLACGKGRWTHFLKEKKLVKKVFAVDQDSNNVDICKKRFKDSENVEILKTNGYCIPLKEEVDFIFCFDSMVHFDVDAVISYLLEAKRVLKVGGKAFFHHSNYTSDIDKKILEKPHWRNFMDKDLFKNLAEYAGLSVIDQKIIDWAQKDDNLDCLTLLERSN